MKNEKFKRKIPFLAFLILNFALTAAPLYADPATPPKKKKKAWLQNLGKTLGNGSNAQPASVAGVRGLDEPAKEGDLSARNYSYIDHLEALTISGDELKKFLKEGNLE